MSLRRPLIVAGILGVAGLVVTTVLGHPVMGILGCIGLGLGVFNHRLLQRSVVKPVSVENPTRKALGVSSMRRLFLITPLAVAFGLVLRPGGLGASVGLARYALIVVPHTR